MNLDVHKAHESGHKRNLHAPLWKWTCTLLEINRHGLFLKWIFFEKEMDFILNGMGLFSNWRWTSIKMEYGCFEMDIFP